MTVSSSSRYIGFSAAGRGVLRRSDMNFWLKLPNLTDPNGVTFEVGADVNGIEPGFFTLLPTVQQINLPDAISGLSFTKEQIAALCRGRYDREICENEAFGRFLHLAGQKGGWQLTFPMQQADSGKER